MSIVLNEGQQEAYVKILAFIVDPDRKYFILSGMPGTGKSTLINYMMEHLGDAQNTLAKVLGTKGYSGITVAATTNSAVDNLNKTFVKNDIRTIHSLLSLVPQNGKLIQRSINDYRDQILIIDEYTLIDFELFTYLDSVTSKVILVGDTDQLLAVKGMAHQFANKAPDHYLHKSERTSSPEILSVVNMFRDMVRDLDPEDLNTNGYTDVESITEDEFLDRVNNPQFSFSGSRIITHTNQTAISINQQIRAARGLPEYFVKGERVILNKYVRAGNTNFKTDSEYVVESASGPYIDIDGKQYYDYAVMDEWGIIYIMPTHTFDLRSMYCSTVYKAQGRSFDTIYIDVAGFPNNMTRSVLTRALYVGASRARKKVIFIGELSDHLLSKL